jgi:hypothetical protein
MLIPGAAFPELAISLASGGRWTLDGTDYDLALIGVMRGYFCTYCHDSLLDLDRHAEAFRGIGIDVLTTSTDDSATAEKMTRELGLARLSVGFGLTLTDIRRLGLFATERQGKIFAEPAILMARRGGTVYAVFQTSISCGRLDIERLLEGLQLLAPAGFPLRGNA